ncbi:MAG TPA: dihydroneopterin aldolase [Candidatus Baltobacteraceae bacterium]|nr:dihydroneopterin aldolase [Candidatus Baltobacteraceae bacterium]
MARIALRNVRALGRHGADPGERQHEQPFDIDLTVELDTTAAERSDELSDTLDYAALHRRLVTVVGNTSFALIERLARALLDAVFEDERVVFAELTIAKPEILAGATPSVTLERRR